jgi:hypothetical protein
MLNQYYQKLQQCLRVASHLLLPVMTQSALKKYRSFDKKEQTAKMKRDTIIDSFKEGCYRGVIVCMIIQLFSHLQNWIMIWHNHAFFHNHSSATPFWLTSLRIIFTIMFSCIGYWVLNKTIFKIRDVIANKLNASLTHTARLKKYLARYGFMISSYVFVELLNNARHGYHLNAYRVLIDYNNSNKVKPYFDLSKTITGSYKMDYRLIQSSEQSLYKDGVIWMDDIVYLNDSYNRFQMDFITISLDELYNMDRNLVRRNQTESYQQQKLMEQRDFLIYLMENNNEQENLEILEVLSSEGIKVEGKRHFDMICFQHDLVKKYLFKDKLEHSLNEKLNESAHSLSQNDDEEEIVVKI